MRSFLVACIAAVVIAIGAYVVLTGYQKPAEVAYKTGSARI
jgi:hypothetical protein